MTERERLALEEVRREQDTAVRVLREVLERRPNDQDAGLVASRLGTTYMLRLYATFEGLLRSRLGSVVQNDEGLTNLVQRIAREGATHDPATNTVAAWWSLFRRDRNPLMHGRQVPPAWSINITLRQMQVFLTQFP